MATRVIIRAQVSEFPDPTMEDIISIIQAFTSVDGFQSIGIDDGQHYVHIEPQQDYARPRASFHVILDFYIKNHSEAANLPHRLYRAQRAKDDTMYVVIP